MPTTDNLVTTPGRPAPPPATRQRRPAAAAWAACGLLLAAVALRLAGIWEYRFNSDEAQHAHVAWGWTRGLVQYRDFFDNHTPLFHLAWAPLVAAFGEHVRTLFWLRLSMLPLYLGCLAFTFAIGRRLLSARAALWGTVLTALLPPFFVKTLEFRTDVPWTLLWLGVFQALTGGPLGAGRLFAAGLLAGAAAAVSLKSSLLFVCVLASALAAAAWRTGTGGGQSGAAAGRPRVWVSDKPRAWAGGKPRAWMRAGGAAAAALAGVLAVPAAVAVFFQRQGALDALLAGAVRHNLLVGQHGPSLLWRAMVLAAGVPVLLVVARWSLGAGPPELARQRLFLALVTGSYWIAMQVLWPLITSQTWLPVEPLFCLFVAAAATGAGRWAGGPAGAPPPAGSAAAGAAAREERWPLPGRAFLALALAVEVSIDLLHGPLRGDQTGPQTVIVAEALRLTAPDEAVFDDKGDLVFRRRAFYPVLEDITRDAMAKGRIADTIPESILASHACVAIPESRRLPPRGRAFLASNFLPVGHLRVCGKWLSGGPPSAGALPPGEEPSERDLRERAGRGIPDVTFMVAIAARYTIVGRGGPARGRLDGVELNAPRDLAAGSHRFEPRSPPPWALLWARAAERGFSPFSAAARESAQARAVTR
jgi:hypothetical protein